MKIVLQRVRKAQVRVREKITGEIEKGLCLLVGIEKGDTEKDALYLAEKISGLRIFPDSEGKMNLSLRETGGEILAVSQFTLAGSVRKGRRPSFDRAERPDKAEKLFNYFVNKLRERSIKTETGIFGAVMDVYLVNDGPVTFIISS
ncbi:MAG: D-tyrosyl-tRNA(Tyr) deacylase [Candidatus Aminicenantes bacterium]|nr:D-tyrosyl-tRNA(Tyr) deacylase [Candidatus Aminicenantes bacterium]HHF51209.1 D-tyrosyl-tRNA(Tyr) deacylase [Candidatus Aminicenantes bacterium]